MLTVACVLKSGGIYDHTHVDRLQQQVAKHLQMPHAFVCLTDMPEYIDGAIIEPLQHDWPGWWSKIELFRPTVQQDVNPGVFEGRVLYLDLDVDIVGSLDNIADFDAPFAAINDYQYPMTINSSVMVWDAGVADHVFNEFTPAVMERFRGDQNWIYNRIPAARRFPREWCVSYKATVVPLGRVPDDARVVVYHGKPKPWDLTDVA